MAVMFSGEKNSVGEIVSALIRANASMAFRLP